VTPGKPRDRKSAKLTWIETVTGEIGDAHQLTEAATRLHQLTEARVAGSACS